jgi:hypothetical protein
MVTPNAKFTGAARLYRAASGGPQGYAALAQPLPEATEMS